MKGMLTQAEMTQRLRICTKQLEIWRAAGLLRAHLCNEKNEYLYEDPGSEPPRKAKGVEIIGETPSGRERLRTTDRGAV